MVACARLVETKGHQGMSGQGWIPRRGRVKFVRKRVDSCQGVLFENDVKRRDAWIAVLCANWVSGRWSVWLGMTIFVNTCPIVRLRRSTGPFAWG